MKRYLLTIFVLCTLFIISCAPVLRKEIMDVAIRDVPFQDIKKNPELYRGKLFVLGGIIVNTKLTPEGSLIEALYAPVDSRGYLKGIGASQNRFLALFPQESGILDPVIFRSEREITLAGEFTGIREGKIDDMDYRYPFFRIREIYLWEEKKEYYLTPYYKPYPYWWDYPYPYWRWEHPYWWRYRPIPRYWW